jgi:hypothetical protein
MRGPKLFDQNARRLAMLGLAVKTMTPVVRSALRDRRVRSALDDTYGSGRRVYQEVRGSEPKDVAARVARDENLQAELAALVRSAARAFDEGVATTKHRARRRFVWVVAMAGGALAFLGIRNRSWADRSTTDSDNGGPSHGMTDNDIVGRAIGAPAARGLAEH